MKFYRIQNSTSEIIVTSICDDDIVVSVWQDNLKYISKAYANKIGATYSMRVDEIEEALLDDADFAECILGDNIALDSLLDDALYFDSSCDTFYDADDIRGWETFSAIYDHDGSNFRLVEILEEYEVEMDEESETITSGTTGSRELYTIKNSINKVLVDYSNYQGARDTVEEGEEFLE